MRYLNPSTGSDSASSSGAHERVHEPRPRSVAWSPNLIAVVDDSSSISGGSRFTNDTEFVPNTSSTEAVSLPVLPPPPPPAIFPPRPPLFIPASLPSPPLPPLPET